MINDTARKQPNPKGRIFGITDLVTLTNEIEKQTHNNKQLNNYQLPSLLPKWT